MEKKILIIEDEEILTKSLKKLLEKEGYGAETVHNGMSAMEKIKTDDFNLIICDIRMPKMDGIETIRAIRKHLSDNGKKPIPEIIITGYADETKYKDAVNLKVADYIYKPFDTSDFLAAVKKNIV